MAIVVTKSKEDLIDGYTSVPNWIYDRFKYDEIAVISYLLSKPNNWIFNKREMCNTLGMGRDKMNVIFKMLFDIGMVKVDGEKRSGSGRFQNVVYHFSLSNGKPSVDNRVRESVSGNPTSNNTDYNNTDFNKNEVNKKNIKKEILNKKEKSLGETKNTYEQELVVLRALNKVSLINTREDNGKALNTIKKVLEGGATTEEIVKVINLKHQEWQGTEYHKYLRYQTIFRKSKFDMYLEELRGKHNPNPTSLPTTPLAQFFKKKTLEQQEKHKEMKAKEVVMSREERDAVVSRADDIIAKMKKSIALKELD